MLECTNLNILLIVAWSLGFISIILLFVKVILIWLILWVLWVCWAILNWIAVANNKCNKSTLI